MTIALRRIGNPAALLICCLASAHFAAAKSQPLRVVATTTHLGALIREIGGQHVTVKTLTSPGSCPGHYDIRPGDVRAASRARILFVHGYEGYVERLRQAAGGKVRVLQVGVKGNWLVPKAQARAAAQMARLLAAERPGLQRVFHDRAARFRRRIGEVAGALRKRTLQAGLPRVAVLCSDQQAELAQWLGMRVVAAYPRPEEMGPAAMSSLARQGRQQRVRLVIDNLQSGPRAGAQLAQQIGAAHVCLSNFPGGFAGTQTWEKCLDDNVRRIIAAVRRQRAVGDRD